MNHSEPAPGTLLEVELDGLGYGGAGLGRLADGRRVRVPKALPGERVQATVVRARGQRIDASLTRVLRPAATRVAAPCPRFARCGGCSLQHVAYEAQLAHKVATLRQRFQRALGDEAASRIGDAVGADRPLGYRTRNHFAVAGATLGFHAPGGTILDVDDCPIATPATETVLAPLRAWLREHGPWPQLRTATIRTGTEGTLLVLGCRERLPVGALAGLVSRVPRTGVFLAPVDADGNAVGSSVEHVDGPTGIADRLGELRLTLSPTSFAQTNPQMAARIYRHVVAALPGGEDVLDLFAGSGGLSLHLAATARSVLGVELHHPATLDAAATAIANGIANATFRCGRAETIARRLFLQRQRRAVVTMNPPRSGLPRELLPWLPRLRANHLAYVSCSPATLTRDLVRLHELGYRLRSATPFDLFPQTSHLEVVAILDHANGTVGSGFTTGSASVDPGIDGPAPT